MSANDYEPTQVAQLIEQFRKSASLSVRKAANIADISESRWRQIAKGYQQATKEVRVPVNAPPETLARMAMAVDMRSGNLLSQDYVDELSKQVAKIMEDSEVIYPELFPVFGGYYDDPDYLPKLGSVVRELQYRVEALETKMAGMSSRFEDPDYSDMSEEEAFELGLAAKKGDEDIGHDEPPHQP